jgi:hypothetical protein
VARSYRYLCKVCNGNYDAARTPGITVCEPDHTDMVRLKRLYTTIVVKHPSLKKVSFPEVMERLWSWYLKHEHLGPAPEPEPDNSTIEELDKVF